MGKTTLVEWKVNSMLTHSLCPNLKELETVAYSAVYLTHHFHISISNSTKHMVQYRHIYITCMESSRTSSKFTDNLLIT